MTTDRVTLNVSAHALPARSSRDLLQLARAGLTEAEATKAPGMRYATAHLAALRGAAAVLAGRAVPVKAGPRARVTSVWTLLPVVAPELTEWAAHFAAGSSKRAAAEAGIPRVVTDRDADDIVRTAGQFLAVVEVGFGFTAGGAA